MKTIELIKVTRGIATVVLDGRTYEVNGEGLVTGEWVIFEEMIYRVENDEPILVADPAERRCVVQELCKYWDTAGFSYILE